MAGGLRAASVAAIPVASPSVAAATVAAVASLTTCRSAPVAELVTQQPHRVLPELINLNIDCMIIGGRLRRLFLDEALLLSGDGRGAGCIGDVLMIDDPCQCLARGTAAPSRVQVLVEAAGVYQARQEAVLSADALPA
jgi:hypothetical protein